MVCHVRDACCPASILVGLRAIDAVGAGGVGFDGVECDDELWDSPTHAVRASASARTGARLPKSQNSRRSLVRCLQEFLAALICISCADALRWLARRPIVAVTRKPRQITKGQCELVIPSRSNSGEKASPRKPEGPALQILLWKCSPESLCTNECTRARTSFW